MKTIVAVLSTLVMLIPLPVYAQKVQTRTINGTVSMGSSMGVIGDGFTYSFGFTRGVQLLTKGCGVRMAVDEFPCIVKFRAIGNDVIEILSAKRPGMGKSATAFSGARINLPGSVFDTELCLSPQLTDACEYVQDANVFVEQAGPDVALVRYNEKLKFVSTQRVVINCKGGNVSLRSVMVGSFPSGIKSCR